MWLSDGSNETILANTANIGLEGICVYLNQPVDLQTKVEVHIHFTNPPFNFKCLGTVVRSVYENDRFYATAIKFAPLSEDQKVFLKLKISQFMAMEKKGKD